MGRFSYEGEVRVEFEDRLLAHLQLIIGTKLRRGESFYFSWGEDSSIGEGRTTIWLHPHCTLVYRYSGRRKPRLNMSWVDALAYTANSPAGLYIVPEPAETTDSPSEIGAHEGE